MADKAFWAYDEKTTDSAVNDEVLIQDSEDWNIIKRMKNSKFVWPTWADWEGVNWDWAYNAWTTYAINDAVSYDWGSYICILASTGNLPTNWTYWNAMAEKGADWSDWQVVTVVWGDNITVDATDPANPIVNGSTTPTFSEVTLDLTQDYKIIDRGNSIVLQGQTTWTESALEIYTADWDGTDDNHLRIIWVWTPTDIANAEYMDMEFDAGSNTYKIYTQKTWTGTVRPLHIYTDWNTSQIVLNTDWSVSFAWAISASNLSWTNTGDQVISDATITTTDITTNNTSTSKHWFAPKLSWNSTQYLDWDWNWATPAWVVNSYTTTTFTSQTSIVVNHGFWAIALVQILDGSSNEIIPENVQHTSINSFTVTFNNAESWTIIASVWSPQAANLTTATWNYTIVTGDNIIKCTWLGSTITLLTAAWIAGIEFKIDNDTLWDIFLTGTWWETIQWETTQTLPSQNSVTVYSDGTNWRIN